MNLPNDLNAEAAVLSAMMIDQMAIIKAVEVLDCHDFYRTSHQIIYQNMVELFDQNKPVDILTLINQLNKNNALAQVGGEIFINELSDVVNSIANIETHINIVLDLAKRRTLIKEAKKIQQSCFDNSKQTEEIIDKAQKEILSINNTKEKPFFNANEACQRALKVIEHRMTGDYEKSRIVCGINDLDDIVRLDSGQVMIIDGMTSNGKTVLAMQYAFLNAVNRNKKVAAFTMEMQTEYLIFREIARLSEGKYQSDSIPHRLVKYPQLATEKQREKIAEIVNEIAEKKFIIDHTPNQTGQQILAKCMQIKHILGGLDLIVVDYMQLMRSTEKLSREQQVSEFSKHMKMIASTLGCGVIALSQVNADGSARESRAIEHDTDIRISVTIPKKNKDLRDKTFYIHGIKTKFVDIPENFGIISVKKNRHGKTSGHIYVEFVGDHQYFKEWSQDFDFGSENV